MNLVTPIFKEDIELRISRIATALKVMGVDAILLSTNANIYYTCGRVFAGYTFITADGDTTYFVRRPVGLEGENVVYVRKPEQITGAVKAYPKSIAIELDGCSYNEAMRLKNVFPEARMENASNIMRAIRARKTDFEIEMIKSSAAPHMEAYKHIPELFHRGMTDLEMHIAIEHKMRSLGCIGQFRINGQSMEFYSGNVLTGDNADSPTPYDFAMGGAGQCPSLPVGANGTEIRVGNSLMVDMGGNFNGYMADITRSFKLGKISDLAMKAHQTSIEICRLVAEHARPGVMAKELYAIAIEKAKAEGLEDYFMGHRQQAGFIGHGVGIEVNEAPVLAPKSKDMIEQGNIIAVEPKFVIPGVGAVGVENTYAVLDSHTQLLSPITEEMIDLE